MRELALAGVIAFAFGALPWWLTGELGLFSAANFAFGAVALAVSAARALARLREALDPVSRRVLGRGLARVALALVLAVGLERAATFSGIQLDWSFERKFQPAAATLAALEALPPVEAFLYVDPEDPRIRATRLLLRTLAKTGELRFEEKRLADHPEEEDCFAIASSNTLVLTVGRGPPCRRRFERVDRPTEGALYEGLFRLREWDRKTVYVARGAGEGDFESTRETGFSGLATALATEGYRVRGFVLAAREEIPEDADVVVLAAPERRLPPRALEALDRYLRRGGRLVAFLEPGVDSGLEALLARWGMESPDALVVDPASAPAESDAPGLDPLAYTYASRHPITETLGPNRMTFFRGARSFALRKPEPDDELAAVVYASPRSWLAEDADWDGRRPPPPPPGVVVAYHALVVTGVYPREGGQARVVAFGDADLASNRYLRSLYNLDLVLNAVHWAASREPDITLRPKVAVAGRLQFPIPIESTLVMFQGLGLLLPELLLIAGAVVWLRRRSA